LSRLFLIHHFVWRLLDLSGESEELLKIRVLTSSIASVAIITELIFGYIGIVSIPMHYLCLVFLPIMILPIGYSALREFIEKPFNVDFLMTIVSIGAIYIGAYHEALLILILFNFSEYIEDKTIDKLKSTLEEFSKLVPKVASVITNRKVIEINVENIKVGDILLIKPGERIPVDGVILEGNTTIDTSAVTGESIPVDVHKGDTVLSGTINLTNSIKIKATKPFIDSTVSRITKLVLEARERKTRIERFIDKFSLYYTPVIIILALLTIIIPVLLYGQGFKLWLYRALVLLVLACPSALIISTPITYFVGITRATRSGVIVKGSVYIETLSKVKAMAFDKTGTITQNKLVVKKIIPINTSERDLLKIAAALEAQSNHPVAVAIVEKAKEIGLEINASADVKETPGMGLEGNINGIGYVMIGNEKFLKKKGVIIKDEILRPNEKAVYVSTNGNIVGVIVLEDIIRESARDAIKELYEIGIKDIIMLTGDREEVARKIASRVSIKKYFANLLPEDKVRKVVELKKEYGIVSMVGDGINDAPALAQSDTGIAIGTAGNDIAIEAADVAVMSDNLRKIPYVVRLSRKIQRILKINLGLTFALKIGLIILGFLGYIPLIIAVLGDDGLTLFVIANVLPILKYGDQSAS